MTTPDALKEIAAVQAELTRTAVLNPRLRAPCEQMARSLGTVSTLAQHQTADADVRRVLERGLTQAVKSLGMIVRYQPEATAALGDLPMRLAVALSET